MEQWLIILGSALAGGFLILDRFAKAKQTSECMLDTYQDLLRETNEQRDAEKGDNHDDEERGENPTEDETAIYD